MGTRREREGRVEELQQVVKQRALNPDGLRMSLAGHTLVSRDILPQAASERGVLANDRVASIVLVAHGVAGMRGNVELRDLPRRHGESGLAMRAALQPVTRLRR